MKKRRKTSSLRHRSWKVRDSDKYDLIETRSLKEGNRILHEKAWKYVLRVEDTRLGEQEHYIHLSDGSRLTYSSEFEWKVLRSTVKK